MKPELTIIIPVYNEEATLEDTINQLRHFQSNKIRILYVNDGSTDQTSDILQKHNTDYIDAPHGGYGSAIKVGIQNANSNLISILDADLQFDPHEIIEISKEILDYDLILGWRAVRKSSSYRKFISKSFNFLTNIILGFRYHDINGLKLFKSSAMEGIELNGNGWVIDTEMVYKMKRKRAKIKEIQMTHKKIFERESKVNARSFLRTFNDILKLRFGLL